MSAVPQPREAVAPLIDKWYEDNADKRPRPHLGASLLGHPCGRYLWLSFRWAVREETCGRMLRLFERGQREEFSIVENLRRIGIEIHSTAADGDGQSRVDLAPHVGGSIDGIIESGVPGAEKTRHVAEFKTHNKRSFEELKSKGVREAKRRHWCQMQCYMHGTNIDRALYVAVCKDNDEIYTERVEYNAAAAVKLVERGRSITLAESIPDKVSDDPNSEHCRYCECRDFCHVSHIIRPNCINCRTCAHITPMADGSWKCEDTPLFNLNPDEQLEGCYGHVLHPDLVPWRFLPERSTERSAAFEIDGKVIMNGGQQGDITSVDLLNGVRNAGESTELPF